jgi:hypothetical protein
MISTTANTQKKEPVSMITTIKKNVVYSFRFTIFVLMRLAYYVMYKYGIWEQPPPPVTITSLSDDYIKLQTSKFLQSYTNPNTDMFSMNIEKCFYDSKLHALAIEDADNELEKTWKRRIMFETTPRGNIIMHYDAYKQGFVYYSDNSNIPYYVINASAMKYVLMFRCRDFFIDDKITPENMHSPLLDIHNKPDTPPETDNVESSATDAKNDETPLLKSSAFAKLKSYNTVSGKLNTDNSKKPVGERSSKDDEKKESEEKKYTRNKIIYSGKISNFNVLQTPKVVKRVAFSSALVDGLKSNSDTQNRVFNYRDFKKLKEKQSSQ